MIYLERLSLRNFCQHRKFDAEFAPGVTGVFGEIGSGKSNIQHAIKFNLTGDLTDLGPQQTCINWYCTSKKKSYVEAVWNLHGNRVLIRRGLRPKKAMIRFLDTNEQADGHAAVSAKLHLLIGIPEKILAHYVFVQQWQTFAFLSQKPADRAKLFSYLCGTEGLSELHKLLSDRIGEDRHLVIPVPQEEIDERRLRKRELCKRLQKLKTDIAKQTKRVARMDIEKLQQAVELVHKKAALQTQIVSVRDELSKVRVERLKTDGIPAVADTSEIENTISLLLAKRAMAASFRTFQSEGEPKEPEEPDLPRPDIDEALREQLTERMVTVSRLTTRLKYAKTGKTICDECGSQVDLTPAERKWLADELKHAKELAEEARLSLDAASQIEQQWQTYETKLAAYKERRVEYDKRKATIREAEFTKQDKKTLQQQQDQLAEWQAINAELLEREQTRKNLNIRITELCQELKDLKCRRSRREAAINSLIGDRDRKTLQQDIEKAVVCREQLKASQRELETTRESLADNKKQIHRLQASINKSANAAKWIEDAESLRDVLHYKELPRDIARARLMALTEPINKMLSQFDVDFSAEPAEDLAFTITTDAGAKTTADRLSGGQKMLLAIAFWLAINSVFVSDVGFLTLDEPTAGLNKKSVQLLGDVLGSFSRTAKMAGRQIIIVTHENALRSAIDQCLELPSL